MTTPERDEANRALTRLARLFSLAQVSGCLLVLGMAGLVCLRLPHLAGWACAVFVSVMLTGAAGCRLFRQLLDQTRGCHRTLVERADQQELHRAILDHAADGIFLCDEAGYIRFVNHSAVRMFGFSAEEVIGQPLTLLLLGDRSNPTGMEALGTNEQRLLGQMTEIDAVRRDNTHFPASVGVSKIRRGGQATITAIVRDQTLTKEARQLAESASRAKSSFLLNISHEFRTPLNGILGMADVLRRALPTGEGRDNLQHLTRSAEALLALVEEILDFTQLEAGEVTLSREPFSLRQAVREAIAPLAAEATAQGLALTVRVDSRLADRYVGDASRLRQLIGHVVGNAIKFTTKGDIEIQLHEVADGLRPAVLLEIRDTGVGIPEDKLERIFVPFEKADGSTTRRHDGVGLGLAIVSRLARLMGGKVTVESSTAGGTTVRVRLPLSSSDDSFIPFEFALEPVMLVFDDSKRGRPIEQRLRDAGWPVCHVRSGHDALLDLYRAVIQGKPYRVLLIAHSVADISLQEILSQHLRLTPGGCILVLHDGKPPARDDWPAGVQGFLPFDFDAQRLSDFLTRLSSSPDTRLAP
jgi:PAS domain S-box-containing protein